MIVQGNLLDFDLSTLHVYCNTLQAIAAGYLVAGIVLLNVGITGQLLVTAALLISYWLLLMFVPFEGHTAGTLEPNANVAYAVDKFVLGRFIDGTQPPYTWVLSSLGFAATTMLGVLAGHVLRSSMTQWRKLWVMLAAAFGCLAAGWAWAEWGGLPIIKHIWTSSMVLWAAGWSFLLLAAFYLLIDITGWRWLAFPLVVIGMNAITIYVANRFIPFRGIAESLVGGAASHSGDAGPLIVQLTSMLLAWLFLYHLYRHRIFLRI
jgi:predicted acyltransferase